MDRKKLRNEDILERTEEERSLVKMLKMAKKASLKDAFNNERKHTMSSCILLANSEYHLIQLVPISQRI